MQTVGAPAPRHPAPPIPHGPLDRFGEIAGALERAAATIARLGALLAGHPLVPAWTWRSRLEAVRRHAAADGLSIDPWHLAAIIEGVRFRMDRGQAIIDRGAIFGAARHALSLWSWFARPDEVQAQATLRADAVLAAGGSSSPLIAAACGAHAWLEQHGWDARSAERAALRAALAQYWRDRGLMPIAVPLLSGTRAFGVAPKPMEAWVAAFLHSLAEEAEAGLTLLRLLEQEWFAARLLVRDRRRDSHALAAVDVMAAAPVVSATSLARGLHIAIKNAAALLDSFVAQGIAIEVTHRSKRRLFGFNHLAPLREEALPPRRAHRAGPSTRHGEGAHRPVGVLPNREYSDVGTASRLFGERPTLSPIDRREIELTGLDDWMREADQVIRRSQAILDRLAQPARPPAAQSDVG